MKRGILSVTALRERCIVDPVRHCWVWQGAASGNPPTPRIWTLDYARSEKRSMSGPLAAWHIAHQAPPRPGNLVFRGCMNALCLNPAHLRQARDKAEIGLHIRLSGSRIGNATEARRANVRLAQDACGIVRTPAEIVRAIRAAPKHVLSLELSRLHGIGRTVVSRIRRGESHRDIV